MWCFSYTREDALVSESRSFVPLSLYTAVFMVVSTFSDCVKELPRLRCGVACNRILLMQWVGVPLAVSKPSTLPSTSAQWMKSDDFFKCKKSEGRSQIC